MRLVGIGIGVGVADPRTGFERRRVLPKRLGERVRPNAVLTGALDDFADRSGEQLPVVDVAIRYHAGLYERAEQKRRCRLPEPGGRQSSAPRLSTGIYYRAA